MDMNEKTKSVVNQVKELTYEEKKYIFRELCDLGSMTSGKISSRFVLIALICLVTDNMKNKDSNISCLKVIQKIIGTDSTPSVHFNQYIECLALVCENFMYACKEFDTFGFKSSDEIVEKIRELLLEWCPF